MLEAALSDPIAPSPVPLSCPGISEAAELLVVGDPVCVALDDDVESVLPIVAAGRQDHMRAVGEVGGFLLAGSGAEVDRFASHTATSGVMCGLPSRRKVVIQKSSDGFEYLQGVVPTGGHGVGITEPRVEAVSPGLSSGLLAEQVGRRTLSAGFHAGPRRCLSRRPRPRRGREARLPTGHAKRLTERACTQGFIGPLSLRVQSRRWGTRRPTSISSASGSQRRR